MTKLKLSDIRWAVKLSDNKYWVDNSNRTKKEMEEFRGPGEQIVRVYVVPVIKKK